MMKEAKLAVLRHLKELMHETESSSIGKHKMHAPETEGIESHHPEEEIMPKEAPMELSEEHPHLESSESIEIEKKEHDEEGIPLDKEKRKAHFLKRMGR